MDLESRLIKLGASRKDLRPHLRPILALIRSASSTLYAVVDQKRGGGITGASDNPRAKKQRFWRGRLPADWKIVRLEKVPKGIAYQLMVQGTQRAWYADDREAFQDARPYIKAIVDTPGSKAAASYGDAVDKYEDMRKQIDRQIKTLEKKIHRYDQKNGRDPNWGNANDLGRVVDLLEQINRFM